MAAMSTRRLAIVEEVVGIDSLIGSYYTTKINLINQTGQRDTVEYLPMGALIHCKRSVCVSAVHPLSVYVLPTWTHTQS